MSEFEDFCKSYIQLFEAIDLCLEKKLHIPALCLIYSGIDTIAWVAYGDIAVKERFTQFVENYMYKEIKLDPRPIDIYAARCAILHTLTPDSDLSRREEAVQLKYALGSSSLEELKTSTSKIYPGEKSCVHINDLSKSFRLGLANFIDSAANNEACKIRMKKHYSTLGTKIIQEFNNTYA